MIKHRNKIISGVVITAILCFIILSGPASATYILGMTIDKDRAVKGEPINVQINIGEDDQQFPDVIDYLTFKLISTNKTEYVCDFYQNASIKSGCDGISIIQINETLCSYGYNGPGYGPCILNYSINIDTAKFDVGSYKTRFSLIGKKEILDKKSRNIIITPPPITRSTCSIRAVGGSSTLNETREFSNNRINFYIPFEENDGEGYVNGQNSKDRYSFRFDVIDIIEKNKDRLSVLVEGKITSSRTKKISERAVITYDKKTGKINVFGDTLEINDMRVYFKEGC